MTKQMRYTPEVQERAVRTVFEQEASHGSQWAAIESISSKIGCTPETLRRWVRQTDSAMEIHGGQLETAATCYGIHPTVGRYKRGGHTAPD